MKQNQPYAHDSQGAHDHVSQQHTPSTTRINSTSPNQFRYVWIILIDRRLTEGCSTQQVSVVIRALPESRSRCESETFARLRALLKDISRRCVFCRR